MTAVIFLQGDIMRINRAALVEMAVEGRALSPVARTWMVGVDGTNNMGIGCRGIHYNVKVGDGVRQHEGDHVEPGVTMVGEGGVDSREGLSFYTFSCIGNSARLVSGDAKGAKGTVTGHHSGAIFVDFPQKALEKMTYTGHVIVRSVGQGLKFLDYPSVAAYGLDPDLLLKMKIKEVRGCLEVPVTTVVPARVMGSGIGTISAFRGDYDIQTSDPAANKEIHLERMRMGDIVAILDYDVTYGYSYREGAMTIGVIVHADSPVAGHGPGVQTVLTTAKRGLIRPVISADANIGRILKIGRWASRR
jgi:hypothetical protein